MYQYKSLNELFAHFADEKVCREYLEQRLWKGQPVCPHCQSTRVYRLANGVQFKCGNKKTCDKKFTVTVGTIFENTKISLTKWLPAIAILTANKKGISSCQLARHLGVTQTTAWFMLHRIRKMITPKKRAVLTEKVMIDETYCGGKAKFKSKKRRKLIAEGKLSNDKLPVLGLLQDNGSAIMQVIEEATSDCVLPMIDKMVAADTLIITDSSNIYFKLQDNLKLKGHISINHAQGEYAIGEYSTNPIESMFACLKRTIYGTYHQVSAKHLQQYLEESCYRFNTRKLKDYERFEYNFLSITGRLKYKDLTKK